MRPRATRSLLLPLAALAVLALVACSGSDGSASAADTEPSAEATSTPEPAETAEALTPGAGGGLGGGGFGGFGGGGGFAQLDDEQLAALFACLGGRGVEAPEGATDLQALFGDGPPSADRQGALGECGTEIGVTLFGGRGGGRFGAGDGNAGALIECLNEEGLDTDELVASGEGGPGPGGLLAGLDRDDPELQAALAVCAPDFGTGGRQ